ncbi:MAG: septal ring lytic transglycosylase RlpA family protein [Proteobacteria bacterium]|nr:septal ring lytic transglycosylase RlpA family protein [Pseudomonadota bacterium]
MTIRNAAACLLAFTCLVVLAACGSNKPKDGPPQSGTPSTSKLPADSVPRPEPKGRYGNGPVYEVLGKRYTVMPSAVGYKERGVASWYGKKFHGNLTSNRETYDMYAMTAAHKTLPLPTYVRVRSLSNGRSIIVRVNDRGPFVDNRIIDLSYAAAIKLDMVGAGTALVEVEAITFANQPGTRTQSPTKAVPAPTSSTTAAGKLYAQVGAFGSRENAERRLALLRNGGIGAAFLHEDKSVSPALYRVRVGPINNVDQYDLMVKELARLGINDPIIVND